MKITQIWELGTPQELIRPPGYSKIIIRNNSTTNTVFILENENSDIASGFPIKPGTQLEFSVARFGKYGEIDVYDKVFLVSGQRFVSVSVMWVN